MAKIPVEQDRSGGGWWKWLLGLVALVLAGWIIWSIAAPEDDEFAVGDDMQQPMTTDTTAMGGDVITDASTIFQEEDKSRLVGRQVRLANMRVEDVQGDSLLVVTSQGGMQAPRDDGMQAQPDPGMEAQPRDGMQTEADNRIIVAGLDRTSPGTPQGEQDQTDVSEGQTVTVIGSIERMQQDQPGSWGITSQEGDRMMQENVIYVRARTLQVNDAAQAQPQPAAAL